jgi:predicted TIM-barrel enzyme
MYTRDQVLERLRATVAAGSPIIGAGAGTGISAKFAERGGADLILIYNSGRYRMNGHGSNAGLMPIGDANAIVVEMGERDVLPVVEHTPVIAGVNGTDPTRVMDRFLERIEQMGFSGVINFPSVGYIDGRWRQSLEATGFGYDREVAMLKLAAERGMFTLAYVYEPHEAPAMAEAGVDVIVAHMGLTTGGSIGATDAFTKTLDDCVRQTVATTEAARAVNPDVMVVCHGGPLEVPADVETVMRGSGCLGFIGASTMERLPTERAIEGTVRGFKEIDLS